MNTNWKVAGFRFMACAAMIALASPVFAATAYVAEGGNDSTAVLDDSDHPFGSIQSAVTALGSEGGTVSVESGTYKETTEGTCVTISTPVEVIGATGNAADVTVTRNGQTARIFKLDHADAKIKYLTVYDGMTTGAGAYVSENGGTIEDCIFDYNYVNNWNYLGGIYMLGGKASRIIVRKHRTHGHTNIRGIGIYLANNAVCENSLFYNNTSYCNGTVYLKDNAILRNCTLADNNNKSTTSGAAGIWADSTKCCVTNCLIYGNWGMPLIENSLRKKTTEVYRGKGTRFFNCVSDAAIADSTDCQVISVDPFVDRANGDYRTTAALRESPSVGYSPVSTKVFSADFRIAANSYLVGVEQTFEAGAICTEGNVTYAWDFGDGTTLAASIEADVTHTFTQAGTYTVTMTAYDGSTSYEKSHTVTIGARSVSVALGDDIQAAIDAAVPGTVIHLAAGVHKPSATLSVTKGVTLVGDGGATNTVITAQNKRTVVSMNDYDAVIRNIAITGGKSDSGAGVKIGEFGGTLEGCIITNNTFVSYGCRGTGITMSNGRVQRCVSARNFCHGHTESWAPGIYITGGQVLNSLIAENQACCNCGAIRAGDGYILVVNCTIVGNVGTQCPGVYNEKTRPRFVNCAIFDNEGTGTEQSKVLGGSAESFTNCACACTMTGGYDWKVGDAAFADKANHNYRLGGSASICFDNGCDPTDMVTLGDLDLDGNPRMVGQIDIGCFENQKNQVTFDFTVTFDRETLPANVTLTPAVDGSEESYTVDWYASNTVSGVTTHFAGDDTPYVWNTTESGVYTFWAVAHIGSSSINSVVHPECLQLSAKDLYVLPVNDHAAWPYDTEATAATNIADAVRAAANGAIVHVLPGETGIFERYEQATLSRAITVQGEAPNRGIMITNTVQSGIRRFFKLDNPNALVANFTFVGGYVNGDAGANLSFSVAGGTVSNCLIKSGHAVGDYRSSFGVATMDAGLITHCEITGEFCSRSHHTQPQTLGAVLIGGNGGNAKVQNCFIHDVTFSHIGEEYYNVGPLVQIRYVDNLTIAHAEIPDSPTFGPGGGGICAYETDSLIRNCVVVDVWSKNKQNALRPFYGEKKCFVNCAGDAEAMNDTCIQSTPAKMFKDYANGNYLPRTMGPLYDKGTEISGFAGITDFAGKPRVFGKAVDIGAFESQMGRGMILLVQ